jgi:hypothetical protein
MKRKTNLILLAFACILTIISIYVLISASNLKGIIIGVGLVLMCSASIIGFFVDKTREIGLPENLYKWLSIASLALIIIGVMF